MNTVIKKHIGMANIAIPPIRGSVDNTAANQVKKQMSDFPDSIPSGETSMMMTTTDAAAPAQAQPVRTPNGHHVEKGYGNTIYSGKVENLPYPKTFDLEAAIEAMYTDGYCIVPGVLNRAEVAELREKMDRSGEDDSKYDMKNWCFNKHLSVDFHLDPFYLKYLDRPGVVDVEQAIHGPGCRATGGTLWITGKGRNMGIHLDYLPLGMPQEYLEDPRVRIPIFSSTAHFYLNDMVEELGPTTVVPKSHLAGRPPNNETTWNGIAPQYVMVKAGDVMIFRTEIWHGAGMNSSDQRRYLMQIFYGYSTLATGYPPIKYESLYNPQVVAQATPRQRTLLGG